MSIGVSGVTHLIGHSSMMKMDSSISGYDSVSRAHFRSESVQRLINLSKIDTLSSWREIVSVHWS